MPCNYRARVLDYLERLSVRGRASPLVVTEVAVVAPINVVVVEPSESFPYYLFVTEGLSLNAMPAPEPHAQRIELSVYAHRDAVEAALGPERDFAQLLEVSMLRHYAHLVIKHGIWVWEWHTLGLNLGETAPQFTNLALCAPFCEYADGNEGFGVIEEDALHDQVTLWTLVPLTVAEMNLLRERKQRAGQPGPHQEQGHLMDLMDFDAREPHPKEGCISFFVDVERKSAV